MRADPRKRRYISYLFVAIAFFVFGLNFRNSIPVATVNGEAIDRQAFTSKVLRLSGESVMNELITEKIVRQEARKRKLTVKRDEIKKRVAELEKRLARQGINLNNYLARQKQTRAELERDMTIQILVEKMFAPKEAVTDRDIDNYFKTTRVVRGRGAILESQLISIKQLVYQQKLRKNFLTWLTQQSKKAKIRIILRG